VVIWSERRDATRVPCCTDRFQDLNLGLTPIPVSAATKNRCSWFETTIGARRVDTLEPQQRCPEQGPLETEQEFFGRIRDMARAAARSPDRLLEK